MKRTDTYKLSNGNLKVLQTIPKMMTEEKWRKKLRELVLEYLFTIKPKRRSRT